jgi:hypothetical protein
LPGAVGIGQDSSVLTGRRIPATRTQLLLGAAMLVCYAVGYPVAIFAHSVIGWVFVTIGGVFLFALGAVTIRRIDRGTREPE